MSDDLNDAVLRSRMAAACRSGRLSYEMSRGIDSCPYSTDNGDPYEVVVAWLAGWLDRSGLPDGFGAEEHAGDARLVQVSLTDEAIERLAAAVRADPKPEIIRTTKPLKGSRIRKVRRPEPPTHVYVVYKTPAGPVALRVFSGLGLAEAFAATASEVEGLYSDESTADDIALARKLAVPMVRCWAQSESATIAPTG